MCHVGNKCQITSSILFVYCRPDMESLPGVVLLLHPVA